MQFAASISAAVLFVCTCCVHADESASIKNRLSITVVGKATGKPETMRIELLSTATSGTAGDALQQCREKSGSAEKAVRELAIAGLTIEREMFQFSPPGSGNPYMMAQAAAPPAGTLASQKIIVKVPDIRGKEKTDLASSISRVLDAANKVGVGVGQSNMQAMMRGAVENPVTYTVADDSELKASALADAMKRAAAKKQRFEDSGIRIGRLLSASFSEGSPNTMNAWQTMVNTASRTSEMDTVSSTDPEKVIVTQTLTMVYELTDP